MSSLISLWRDIRALRASPPGLAATDEARRKEFGASLQQAEEFAAAAADTGYATKPLQLYYGLSQGFRGVCAAHLETDTWRRFGHGLSLTQDDTNALIDQVVEPGPRRRDLHAGAMEAIGEKPLHSPLTVGELMATLIEFRDFPIAGIEMPRPLLLMSPLQRHHMTSTEGPAPAPFLMFAVDGLPEDADAETLKEALRPYPALKSATPTAWPDDRNRLGGIKVGSDRGWIERDGVAYFLSDSSPGAFPIFRLPFDGDGAPAYCAAFEQLGIAHSNDSLLRIAQPAVGQDDPKVLGSLCPWWALLLGFSSLARYHASQWADALALDGEPITPALERVIDLAEEVIPLYLLDALTAAPEKERRTPALD